MGGEIFLIVLAIVWMIFASIQDVRKQEIADWLNLSLIIFAIGYRFFYSLFVMNDFMFLYQGLIGFGIFLALGYALYYSRVFAGGDAKLMIALGAVLPFSLAFLVNVRIFAWFIGAFFLIGSIYGIAWSIYLCLTNFKKFKKDFSKRLVDDRNMTILVLAIGLLVMILGFFIEIMFALGILIFVFPYLFLFAKSVDNSCMVKRVSAKDLTEGDWLVDDVYIGKKVLKANWDGLDKKDIKLLIKNKKRVLIRYGIPFAPVFLIAFGLLLFFYYSKWFFII